MAKVLPDEPAADPPTDTGVCSVALHIRTDDIGVGATPLQVSIFACEIENARKIFRRLWLKRPLHEAYRPN